MTNPLITHHQERVAELYRTEALSLLTGVARTGVTAEQAAEAVTYAFEQLAHRPDLTMTRTAESLVPWLTSVARSHGQRLQLAAQGAIAPPPPAKVAPDLMAALRSAPAPKRRGRPPGRPARASSKPAEK